MTPEETREYKRKWRADNPEKIREYQLRWRLSGREREGKRRWRAANPDKTREDDKIRMRRLRSVNPEKYREQGRLQKKKQREENPERVREVERAYREKNPDRIKARVRDYKLRRSYGITTEDFDRMLEDQGNKCGICLASSSASKQGWHVDHCHSTMKVRGIICHHCNLVLGFARDNIETLYRAIDYLRKAQ